MEHHLSEGELRGYGSGAMTVSALLDADRHLAVCAVCRYQLRQTVPPPRLPAAAIAMGEPVHLTYEQMTAHLDARLTEAELTAVENHRSICRRCAKELAALQNFDDRMASEFAVAANPASQLDSDLSSDLVRQINRRARWFDSVRVGIARFVASPPRLRFAGAGVGLMALGVFTLLQSGTPGDHGLVARLSANVVAASAAMHPHLFYGGFVVGGCGMGALLYAVLKR
jgi:hypothetical protein